MHELWATTNDSFIFAGGRLWIRQRDYYGVDTEFKYNIGFNATILCPVGIGSMSVYRFRVEGRW